MSWDAKPRMPFRSAMALILPWVATVGLAAETTNPASLAEQLNGGLGDETAERAYAALVAMGDAAIPHLSRALADKRKNVRWLAVQVLDRIGSSSVIPPLRTALRDADKDVRLYAATFLGRWGGTNEQVRTDLQRALLDSSSEVVWHALDALRQLGDFSYETNRDLITTLCRRLECPGPDWEHALTALDKIATERARLAGAATLTRLAINNAQSVDVRLKAARALHRIAPNGFVPDRTVTETLLPLMSSDTCAVREATVRALGIRNNVHAVPALSALATDTAQHWVIRSVASESLGRIGDPSGIPALAAALSADEWRLRLSAALALGGIKTPAATAALMRALGDKRVMVVVVGAHSLGRIGDSHAAPALLKLLSDWRALDGSGSALSSHANIATAANWALSQILQGSAVANSGRIIGDGRALSAARRAWRAPMEKGQKD